MTAKDKAEELVLKYLRIDNNTKGWFNTYIAKQCAIIVVEEIIKALRSDLPEIGKGKGYWSDVRCEIENIKHIKDNVYYR